MLTLLGKLFFKYVISMNIFSLKVTLLFLILITTRSIAQFGKNGQLSISSGTSIVNQYAKISNDIPVGQTYIVVSSISTLNAPNNLECGDLIMIYQSQGATMLNSNNSSYGTVSNYNSAGLYEFKQVTSVNGNTISLNSAITNSYSSLGQTQVVKVPQYSNITVNTLANITSSAWNGSVGGIIVIHAKDSIVLNGTIFNTGKGFRGGIARTSGYTYFGTQYVSSSIVDGGEKGEGICGYQSDYDLLGGRYCRGAAANAGGGGTNHNAGGGGGANASNGNAYNGSGVMCSSCPGVSAWNYDSDYISNSNNLTTSSGGGKGGNSFSNSPQNPLTTPPGNSNWGSDSWRNVAGRGGRPLTNINFSNRIYFGGGGGSGDANDNSGGHGARGGGIIILISPTIKGNGKVIANGDSASNSINIHADALGGGGGGGSIIINSNIISNSVNLSANGGKGGSMIKNDGSGYVIGTGGGGGGGYISFPNSSSPINSVTGGLSGKNYYPTISSFPENGGTNGNNGAILATNIYTLINNFTPTNSNIGISYISSYSICSGQSLTITPSGASSYSILPTNLSGTSFTLTPLSNTNYTIYGIGTCFNYTTVSISVNPISLTASGNQTLCSGQSTTLSASGAINYTWTPSSINSNTIIITPSVTTIYTISSINGNGCFESKTINISIIQTPTLTAQSSTICSGSTTTISVSGALNYSWTPLVTAINSNYSSVISTPSITSNYTITGTNGMSCIGSKTIEITVNPTPSLSIVPSNTSICSGNTLTISVSGANTYSWIPINSNSNTVIISPNTNTTYSVIGYSIQGCNSIKEFSIIVVQTPTLIVQSSTICSGNSTTVSITGATNYSWTPSVVAYSSNFSSVILSPSVTTNYTITGSNLNCLQTTTTNINVLATPIITLVVSQTSVCSGNSIIAHAYGASTYTWSNSSSTSSIINIPANSSMTLNVIGTSLNGCNSLIEYQTVSVIPNPQLTISSNQTLCIGSNIDISVTTSANDVLWNNGFITNTITVSPIANTYYSVVASDNSCSTKDSVLITVVSFTDSDFSIIPYDTCNQVIELKCNNYTNNNIWVFSNSETISNTCDLMHQYIVSGNFSIVHISNPNSSCADTTTKNYNVNLINNNDSIEIPNIFTPNGDGVNDYFDLSILFYCQNFELEIFNRWGSSIIKPSNKYKKWDGKTNEGEDVTSGTYFYIIKTKNKSYKGFISLFR